MNESLRTVALRLVLLPTVLTMGPMGAACAGSAPPAQTAPISPEPRPADTVTPGQAAAGSAHPSATLELAAGIKAFDAGSYSEAKAAFEAAVKKTPADFNAFQNLGLTCEKLGDKPAAEEAYKAALALAPGLEGAAAGLSAMYLDEGRVDDALATTRAALAQRPQSAPLHENLGVALAIHGDKSEADDELERAVALQKSEPMFRLTLAHWLNVWKVQGAAMHLDAARNLVKEDYAMIASIGHEYRMAGEFAACAKTFDRAIQIKDGGEVRTERALCRHGLRDEKGTIDDLQAAVAHEPTYAPAHFYYGGRLAIAERYGDAAAEYGKYLDLAPGGSLAKAARERMKAAQEAARSVTTKKK